MTSAQEHPWEAARRLCKELSAILAQCGNGQSYALITPAGTERDVSFGAIGEPDSENPFDKVERLSAELSDALNGYMNGSFHCRIYPADAAGRSVYFVNTDASERGKA
jgi:hypothetical protein